MLSDTVQNLDVSAPCDAEWHSTGPDSIDHEILGTVINNGGEWTTNLLPIGAFGYSCPVIFSMDEGPPSKAHFAAAVNLLRSSEGFRGEVAEHMAQEYTKNIRPDCISRVDESSLPELTMPGDIWKIITGLNAVFVDEELGIDLGFGVTFDRSHDFAVRIRDGMFYEVMLDG